MIGYIAEILVSEDDGNYRWLLISIMGGDVWDSADEYIGNYNALMDSLRETTYARLLAEEQQERINHVS